MSDYLNFTFDDVASDLPLLWDEINFWSVHFGIMLLDRLEIRPNLQILDVACGTGFPLLQMAIMFGRSCRLVGVDASQPDVERARWKIARHGLTHVEVVEADAADMPLDDDRFDLITCNLGINNFDDAGAVFRECFRVAKPGATLALTNNVMGNMREFYAVFRDVLKELGKTHDLDRLAEQERHRRDREAISALLAGIGFKTIRAYEEEFKLRYADGTTFFNHLLIKGGFLPGWKSVLDEEDHAVIFPAIERRLNEIAMQQGQVQMTIPMLLLEVQKPR